VNPGCSQVEAKRSGATWEELMEQLEELMEQLMVQEGGTGGFVLQAKLKL
jgi:hypothetical protein